jgi:acylglycerol lipase
VHGYSDHVNRYYDFFPTLASRGIAVYGFDQRGWGRSVSKPSEKGLTGPTATVMADIVNFLTPHLPRTRAGTGTNDDPPLFVLGHSMGGGEVATLLCDPSYEAEVVSKVRGWLLECPFIGFVPSLRPSRLKVLAGRLAGRLLPHFQLVNPIPAADLTRDPAVVRSLEEDKLCHDTGTLEGLSGMLDRTLALSSHAGRPCASVRSLWLGHATVDKAVSEPESRKWFDAVTGGVADRTFRPYEGCYHQLHADLGREEFYKDVGDWILARVGEGQAAGSDVGEVAKADVSQSAVAEEGKVEAKL